MQHYLSNPDSAYANDLAFPFATAGDEASDRRTAALRERVALLYKELRQPIFRYLLCTRLRAEDAEELTQETFLRLYRHLQKGGPEDNLRGWLYRVAHNLSCTCRKGGGATADAAEQWEQISQTISDPHAGPEEELLHKEKMARLHHGIAQLSQLQRNCVLLRVEGFRYREIADILDVTTSTVAGSLRHAIERLTRDR